MKKILITGSAGRVGKILQSGLAEKYNLILVDKNQPIEDKYHYFNFNLCEESDQLRDVFKGTDAVIHLAWNNFEDFPKETSSIDNKIMAETVYRLSHESGVKRIIIASSVHANTYIGTGKEINIKDQDFPDSLYGASKIYMESLGKFYAKKHGLEVICIRFGGINPDNKILYDEDPEYDRVLLYTQDLINLIRMCIETNEVPDKFQIMYAVSDNPTKVHSTENFLGWHPEFPNQKIS